MFGTAIKYYFGGLALDTKINVFSRLIDFRRPHLRSLSLVGFSRDNRDQFFSLA